MAVAMAEARLPIGPSPAKERRGRPPAEFRTSISPPLICNPPPAYISSLLCLIIGLVEPRILLLAGWGGVIPLGHEPLCGSLRGRAAISCRPFSDGFRASRKMGESEGPHQEPSRRAPARGERASSLEGRPLDPARPPLQAAQTPRPALHHRPVERRTPRRPHLPRLVAPPGTRQPDGDPNSPLPLPLRLPRRALRPHALGQDGARGTAGGPPTRRLKHRGTRRRFHPSLAREVSRSDPEEPRHTTVKCSSRPRRAARPLALLRLGRTSRVEDHRNF
jgi:hypothetical protein